MDNTILAAVMFLGFLALFTTLATVSYTNVVLDATSENVTLGTASLQGVQPVPVCTASTIEIPIVGDAISGGSCVFAYAGWMISFVYVQSNILWLAIPLGAIGAVFIYRAVRLLRGGG